ncbi:MAG TPA: hypothetical protein VM865_07815 [Acidobacteriaceae bacterium]|jgi:hypothetical protein|nr:hypothetical protein [Acidobacteriaceae bacterium]
MGTSGAALIVQDDGNFSATPELQESLQLSPGTRLELIRREGEEIRFRIPSAMREIKSWRDLEGILADFPADPNAELEAERQAELKRDAL